MLINFENLPDTSKVWIYQSNREFSDNEIEIIKTKLDSFLENW